jgi:hypothetical protein
MGKTKRRSELFFKCQPLPKAEVPQDELGHHRLAVSWKEKGKRCGVRVFQLFRRQFELRPDIDYERDKFFSENWDGRKFFWKVTTTNPNKNILRTCAENHKNPIFEEIEDSNS